MIQKITQTEAERLTGESLPDGMNWYHLTKLQFYPDYGDWKQMWTDATGVNALIGSHKREITKEPDRMLLETMP